MYSETATRLTNQEKSARRYASLTAFAVQVAHADSEFLQFCGGFKDVTWRRLETYIKRKYEEGAKIKIVIESSAGGD